jgi:hypothetical protein
LVLRVSAGWLSIIRSDLSLFPLHLEVKKTSLRNAELCPLLHVSSTMTVHLFEAFESTGDDSSSTSQGILIEDRQIFHLF